MNNIGIFAIIGLALVVIIGALLFMGGNATTVNETNQSTTPSLTESDTIDSPIEVTPISHASAVLSWDGITIYTDPVGEVGLYAIADTPDLILLTDIHGDHLSTTTLAGLLSSSTQVIAPQAVADLLPAAVLQQTTVLANGETVENTGFTIEAVPMYNLPESDNSRHTKGRGNGYVLDKDGTRVYIAGDTDDTPEIRALEDIDVAFIPMNPPFTMSVESAAEAVLAFAPGIVYPYHYRTPEGLSDVSHFRELVNEANEEIRVVLLDWYPEQ